MKKWLVVIILTMTTLYGDAQKRLLSITETNTGAYTTGRYRNLFAECSHSEKEIKKKINNSFEKLFYGDSLSQALYFKAGNNANGQLAYICDVLHHDVRSEGMSYGMMIAVQLNKKAEFDALWNYAITHMYIGKQGHPAEGYFAWSVQQNGTHNYEGPASDGEEYFVTALYFAAGRWPKGSGIFDYKTWADKILTNMRHHPLTSGLTKLGLRVTGSMVSEGKKMILFVPENNGTSFSDPSYHLPAFYELWALWGPKADRSFWAAAADTSRSYFQKAANPLTGLCSDYADFEGKPIMTTYNKDSQNFSFDSWRTGMNWSVDWAWWHKDPREPCLSIKVQDFFSSQGINTYGHTYTLDGKAISKGHATGLVATNATLSLAADHPMAKDFVEALWNQPIPTGLGERYYGGLLYMMSLLHCSGNFRIYSPK